MSVTGVATLVLSFLLYRCTKFMFPRITLHESLTILAPYTHARSKIILESLKAFLELQLGKVREMFLANGLISDCEIVPEGALELLDVGSSHRLCMEQTMGLAVNLESEGREGAVPYSHLERGGAPSKWLVSVY